jgi:hypothetical protein
MIFPPGPEAYIQPPVQPGIGRHRPEAFTPDSYFEVPERAFSMGQFRTAAAGNFRASGIANAILGANQGIVVVEKLVIATVTAGSAFNLLMGRTPFAAIANITGGGAKGLRDARLVVGGASAGAIFGAGDDVISLQDDGALATGTPAGLTLLAQLTIPVAGPYSEALGPFYLLPGDVLMVVTQAINVYLHTYIEGHISQYARRR